MRSARDILSAIDYSEDAAAAIVSIYQKSIYTQGQHDLRRCRICGQEENYHTGVLAHKLDCPVGELTEILLRFYPPEP